LIFLWRGERAKANRETRESIFDGFERGEGITFFSSLHWDGRKVAIKDKIISSSTLHKKEFDLEGERVGKGCWCWD